MSIFMYSTCMQALHWTMELWFHRVYMYINLVYKAKLFFQVHASLYAHILRFFIEILELPWWLSGKESACPVQESEVQSLIWEEPTYCGAVKPMCHNCCAYALEPGSHNVAQHMEPTYHSSWSWYILEPVLHKRSHCNEKPVYCNQRVAPTRCNRRKAHPATEIQNSQN